MAFALSERAEAAGYRLVSYDTIGSTNSEALAHARAGERGPVWFATSAQSAGRGRRGREWVSPPGNLAASLLTAIDAPLSVAATVGFVAGLAISEALRLCAPGLDVSLKWPNDVLAGKAKLAGILLESEPLPDAVAVVIGIGVNLIAAPQDLPYAATSLAHLGRRVEAQQLFSALSDAWVDYVRLWDNGRGMARVRSLWLTRAAGVGAPVSVQVGGQIIEGVFETLDEAGRLLVRSADHSLVPVAAGEVQFGSAASARAGAR
jgi:BirA family biotin operon repressor/biotin-[acetyl-CoA-carboxylase] ligase